LDSQSDIERLRSSASGVTKTQRMLAALARWVGNVGRWLRNRTMWRLVLFVLILAALGTGWWVVIQNQG
jgi:hypothetical protein